MLIDVSGCHSIPVFEKESQGGLRVKGKAGKKTVSHLSLRSKYVPRSSQHAILLAPTSLTDQMRKRFTRMSQPVVCPNILSDYVRKTADTVRWNNADSAHSLCTTSVLGLLDTSIGFNDCNLRG